MRWSVEDEKWMKAALEEARKGIGLVSPNPPVGAIVVKNGKEISRGWHRGSGLEHAERIALRGLNPEELEGAVIYVTLEPCSTQGRTGSCCELIVGSGLSKVVYGVRDPNPVHLGRADAILGAAGIEVVVGVCEEQCADLIRGFVMAQTKQRPWVMVKTAMSLDGKISRPGGESQWLTGEEARGFVQELRGEVDAILTSSETLRIDDPRLTLRGPGLREGKLQPWRVILSRKDMEPKGFQVFEDDHRERTIVMDGNDLQEAMRSLVHDYGVNTVLVEAGGVLVDAFLELGLVDEWVGFLAPVVCGGDKLALGGKGIDELENRIQLDRVTTGICGDDVYFRARVNRGPVDALMR